VTNPEEVVSTPHIVGYDKLWKMRWLLDDLRDRFKSSWNCGQYITVNEMMIMYKGKYCAIRQYLPSKPVKWGIKIWCLTDSVTKYVSNFDVYCGGRSKYEKLKGYKKGDPKQGKFVVLNLVRGLERRGHVILRDNFFHQWNCLLS